MTPKFLWPKVAAEKLGVIFYASGRFRNNFLTPKTNKNKPHHPLKSSFHFCSIT